MPNQVSYQKLVKPNAIKIRYGKYGMDTEKVIDTYLGRPAESAGVSRGHSTHEIEEGPNVKQDRQDLRIRGKAPKAEFFV